MTYREKIEEMVSDIQKLYLQAERLRDIATPEEKKYWNQHRGIFFDAEAPLRNLLDTLDEERGDMEL